MNFLLFAWGLLRFFFLFRLTKKTRLTDTVLLKNILVHPYSGLVADCWFRVYTSSGFLPKKWSKLQKYWYRSELRTIDQAVVIGHGPWDNYYHWYIDSVPRLWGLYQMPLLEQKFVLLIARKLTADEKALLQSLLPGNVTIEEVEMHQAFKAKELLYLPFYSGECSGNLPQEYLTFYKQKVFALFKTETTLVRYKIFIVRLNTLNRKLINLDDVMKFVQARGFICLVLEELSLPEQIHYFRNASLVVGSHGAGFTNLLYASNCSVLEIFHSPHTHLYHYRDLANASGLQYDSLQLGGTRKNEANILPLEMLESKLSGLYQQL